MNTPSRVLCWLTIGLGLAASVSAQDPGQPWTPQQKLMAQQAANRDAQRKLAEQIYGLRISSNTTVRDFVTQNDDIKAASDSFIKGIRLGEPTFLADGTCEVPASVTLKTVVTTLEEIHKRHYKGDNFKAEDFQRITQENKFTELKVVGNGAIGGAEPPPPVQPVAPVAAPQPVRLPAIWLQYGGQARLMAKRGAEVDALRKLAERIYGLHITSKTTVRDFVTQSDEIKTDMDTFIKGATFGEPTYSEDGICSVTASVPLKTLITRLEESHKRYYKGNDFKAEDFQRMTQEVKVDIITETGSSALDVTRPPAGQPQPQANPQVYPGTTPQGNVEIKKSTTVEVTIEGEPQPAPQP